MGAWTPGPAATSGDDSYNGAGDGDVTLDGLAGDDTILAGDGNDSIQGGDGTDSLSGGLGDDTMSAGNGAGLDVLDGGDGADTLYAGATGNGFGDSLAGGNGDDTLIGIPPGDASYDVFDGGAGDDHIVNVTSGDSVYGGDGDDLISQNYGNGAVIDGGDGYDTLEHGGSQFYSSVTSIEALRFAILPFPGPDSSAILYTNQFGAGFSTSLHVTGSSVANSLTIIVDLSAGPDFDISAFTYEDWSANDKIYLVGDERANVLTGGDQSEILIGSSDVGFPDQIDTLMGGGGDDTYRLYDTADVIVETANGGVDTIYTYYTAGPTTLPDFVENLVIPGDYSVAVHGIGNALDNQMTARSLVSTGKADNVLEGLDGADTLDGGDGGDTLEGGNGDDVLIGGAGADHLDGGDGVDTADYSSASARVVIDMNSGAAPEANPEGDSYVSVENIIGSAFDDSITGDDEANSISTGGGEDILTGGGGDDTLDAGDGDGVLFGGDGDDTLIGTGALQGGLGDDTYYVQGGASVVENANEGVDTVIASANLQLQDNFENLILVGLALSGTGNGGDNVITGTDGFNTLTGGLGDDTLIGGAGGDSLIGGAGADHLDGGAGADTISYLNTAGAISINLAANTASGGEAQGDVISSIENVFGSDNADLIIGNSAANLLFGGGGADTLDGGGGADTLSGGLGADVYYVDNVGDSVIGGAGDTIRSSIGITLLAQAVSNLELLGAVVTGNGNDSANRITGNAANNSINGGLGADTMLGGLGDDTYFVDNAGDVVNEQAGQGTDTIFSTLNVALLAGNVENLTISGTATTATGNSLNNVISGNSNANTLNGGSGEDTLQGGLGNDTYVVNSAGDVVIDTGGNNDTILAYINVAALNADIENLTLAGAAITGVGNALNNIVTGNSLNNVLSGGDGADSLNGSVGADTMTGGLGDDAFLVENAGDVVNENSGEGNDIVYAFVSISGLAANVEKLTLMPAGGAIDGVANGLDNRLNGNDSANVLTALGGADVIQGLGGDDRIIGGAGLDNIFGGTGSDVFVYQAASDTGATGATRDIINDFTQGADTIDLSAIDAVAGGGDDAFSFIGANAFTHTAGELRYELIDVNGTGGVEYSMISLDVNGDGAADSQITIKGWVTFTSADFVL